MPHLRCTIRPLPCTTLGLSEALALVVQALWQWVLTLLPGGLRPAPPDRIEAVWAQAQHAPQRPADDVAFEAQLLAEYSTEPSPVAHRIVARLDEMDRRRPRSLPMVRTRPTARAHRRARAARRTAVQATAPPAPPGPPGPPAARSARPCDLSRLGAEGAS